MGIYLLLEQVQNDRRRE